MDVTFEAEGKVWRMRFGINALADLEARTGQPINEVFAQLEGASMKVGTLRTVVQSGLSKHHGDLTAMAVGDLIDAVGLSRMAGILGQAVKAAFPDASGEAPAEA